MAWVLSENAVAAVEQHPVELFGRVGASYGCGGFRVECRKDSDTVLTVLQLGVPELSVSEELYLGGGDHGVGLDLSCDALEEGLLVLLDSVGGGLGGDEDTGNRKRDCLCVD